MFVLCRSGVLKPFVVSIARTAADQSNETGRFGEALGLT